MSSAPRTPVPMPRFGLGGAPIANLYAAVSDADAAATVDAAWDAGVRYFDTAPHYGLGLGERRLGAALARRPRGEYVLSTKVGRLLVPSPETAGRQDSEGFAVPASTRRVWDFSGDGIRRSIDDSLDRLGTDSIDIAYLHDPDAHWETASTSGIDALVRLRDEGVVRAIGVGMNQTRMLTEFVRRGQLDLVMVAGRYTLLDQSAADELLPAATEHGVGVVAAAVFNSGMLSTPVVPSSASYDYAPAPAALIARAERIAAIGAEYGVMLPEAALAFPARHEAVVSVVAGAVGAEQVAETTARLRATPPAEFWDALAADGIIPA